MPFIRYTRDKRGYECTFVMHAYRAANGASRTRVLYLFRSPSSLKVGREPLDSEVREALEHTHPDLTFDWQSLQREPPPSRPEPRERYARPAGRAPQRPEPQRPPAQLAEPEIVVEDETLLGRTVGGREAARLRGVYNELLARISRRARTPEERDRLTERAARLNPDDWQDPAAISAAVANVEVEWRAISAELPQRRRGRRGRARLEASGPAPSTASTEARDASGIIEEDQEQQQESLEPLDATDARRSLAPGHDSDDVSHILESTPQPLSDVVEDRHLDSVGDGDPLGSDAHASTEPSSSSGPDASTASPEPGADPGFPSGD